MYRASLLAAAVVLAAPVVAAAPAHADHEVSIAAGRCHWGPLSNGIGIALETGEYRVQRDAAGTVVGFTCRFRGVPAYVSAEDSYVGSEWVRPRTAVRGVVEPCFHPEGDEVGMPYGVGTSLLRPNGTATLTCRF